MKERDLSKEHNASSPTTRALASPHLLLVVFLVVLSGSLVVADRRASSSSPASRRFVSAFLAIPPSTTAPVVGVRPSSSPPSSSPPSIPSRVGGGYPLMSATTTTMTWALPRSRPTVAELEAESEALRAEIEGMRAEALRRLGELRERLTAVGEETAATTTTTKTATETVTSATEETGTMGSSTKPGGTTLVEYLDSSKEGGPSVETWSWTTTEKTYSDPLEGTRWKVSLDVGREPGTWMPAEWGRSGRRINLSFVAEFDTSASYERDDMVRVGAGGGAKVLRVVDGIATLGPSVSEGSKSYVVRDGAWRVSRGEGPMGTDILRFYVEVVDDRIMHSDGDVYIPGGRVYCSCGYFPSSPGDGKDVSTYSAREALIGELRNIEERMTRLRKKKDGISNPFDLDGFKISNEISRLKREARIVNGKLNFNAVTEPDRRLLRFSKDGDIGLTREGGVCCQVNKGPMVEYRILGRFSIASVDRET